MVSSINGSFSNQLHSSNSSPQDRCLSPLLYILYSNECRSNHKNRHVIKFADDSVITSILEGEEHQHGPTVDNFVSWRDESFLQLNVSKAKDTIISFRKTSSNVLTTIKGAGIELVDGYKYFGIILDILCFESRAASTSFFLRSFNVFSKMMTLFYRSFIESVLMFCIVVEYGNLTLANKKNRLGSRNKVASKISGRTQAQLTDLYNKQVFRKDYFPSGVPRSSPSDRVELLPSSRCFKVPVMRTKRDKVSFVPATIYMLNSG